MHDKTQVFPLTTNDNIHSRLTHSLEVMAIGHSLGIRLCEDEDFKNRLSSNFSIEELIRSIPVTLKNACLIHDVGNPPFGHFGEKVIQLYFKKFFKSSNLSLTDVEKNDFYLFDGNAQGFRVITKLQMLNDKFGLNLTYATLGTFIKYTNYGSIPNPAKRCQKKIGVFQSEIDYFQRVAQNCETKLGDFYARHPLCYLMEAADSICYLTMDIEDGYNVSLYSLKELTEFLIGIPNLKPKVDAILSQSYKYGDKSKKIVAIRLVLIEYLVDLAIKNFIVNIGMIENGTYDNELIYDDEYEVANKLQKFTVDKIFQNRMVTSLELTGHSVLTGLLDYYLDCVSSSEKHYYKRAQSLISHSILRSAFAENGLPEHSSINRGYVS